MGIDMHSFLFSNEQQNSAADNADGNVVQRSSLAVGQA